MKSGDSKCHAGEFDRHAALASLADWMVATASAAAIAAELAARRDPVIFGFARERLTAGNLRAEVRFTWCGGAAVAATIELFDAKTGTPIGRVFEQDNITPKSLKPSSSGTA